MHRDRLGRPETDEVQGMAMSALGNGLSAAGHHEDALTVEEAGLAMLRRVGAGEEELLVAQCNLACSYERVGRLEEALRVQRDVYSARLKLNGDQHEKTLRAALNYAVSLQTLKRFEEAKALFRRTIPVARRVLGEGHRLALKMRWVYAKALYSDGSATLDDLREAVTTLEDTERIARRVLGGAHPLTVDIERELRNAQAALRAREETQDAFRTARANLAQERSELAQTLADAAARLPRDR